MTSITERFTSDFVMAIHMDAIGWMAHNKSPMHNCLELSDFSSYIFELSPPIVIRMIAGIQIKMNTKTIRAKNNASSLIRPPSDGI